MTTLQKDFGAKAALPHYDETETHREGLSEYQGSSSVAADKKGTFINRSFWMINKTSKSNITVFVSEDARKKYNLFKDVKHGSEAHHNAITLQQQGLALPILKADHHANVFSRKFLTIYRFVPPPVGENRLFDSKKDCYKFCEVTEERRLMSSIYTYTLKFTPDPTDSSKDFVLHMFQHSRLPITDVTSFEGQRLRWVGGFLMSTKKYFEYELDALDPSQPSLVDGLSSDFKVSKSNPLYGKSAINTTVPRFGSVDRHKGGEFVANLSSKPTKNPLSPDLPAVLSYDEEIADDSVDRDSIKGVGEKSIILLSMACCFKTIEDLLYSSHLVTSK